MRAWCAAAWKRDGGQAFIEYSLILALVAAGLFTVLLLFRDSIGPAYGRVGKQMDTAGSRGGLPPGTGGAGRPAGPSEDPGSGKGHQECGGGQGGGYGRGGGGGCGGVRDW